jgi:hypothetical protein
LSPGRNLFLYLGGLRLSFDLYYTNGHESGFNPNPEVERVYSSIKLRLYLPSPLAGEGGRRPGEEYETIIYTTLTLPSPIKGEGGSLCLASAY